MLPPTIPIACLAIGDFHGRADTYLNRLYSMLERHCPTDFSLTCFTDSPRKISSKIQLRPCSDLMSVTEPGSHPTNYKLGLFKKNILPFEEFIYLDITIVIRQNMKSLLEFSFSASQDLIINDDWNYTSYNSSVMRIRSGALQTITDAFESGIRYPMTVPGDQDFIYGHIGALNWQDRVAFWPEGQIISFKKTQKLNRTDPLSAQRAVQKATIVKFHGKPRMHRFANPFYKPFNFRDSLFFKKELYRNWR